MNSPSEHSRLSPSSAYRWLVCPGSAVDNPPDTESAASKEGTLAHEFAAKYACGMDTGPFPSEEMEDAAFKYCLYVNAAVTREVGEELLLETRIVSKTIPDFGGTMDALIIGKDFLHVIDFKYGLQPVMARDNKQLLSYLVLANEEYPGKKEFYGSIVQPRVPYGEQYVEFSIEEVENHYIEVLFAGSSDNRSAGKHCTWCPLRNNCNVLDRLVVTTTKKVFDDSKDWDATKCQEVLDTGIVVAELVKDAKKRIKDILQAGEDVPGWKLVESLGNRAWTNEDEVVKKLLDKGLNNDIIYNRKIKSPAQLEKFSSAYKQFVAEESHRPRKGVVAAEASSRLPEWNVANVFKE